MILGGEERMRGGGDFVDVGRRRQIGPREVFVAQHAGERDARELVVARVAARREPSVLPALVAFVVARPDAERDVVAELPHDGERLVREGFFHVLGLRVAGAPHREILPNENAVLVAEVEEGVVLVDIAAPAADAVAAGIE